MFAGSPWSSLRSRSSASRKHGGPAVGTPPLGPPRAGDAPPGGPPRRHHPGGADLGDVLAAAVHLALALLGAERLLGAGRHVVDHRVPDRARVLQHVHVDLAEVGGQYVEVDGPRVVHVERHGGAVVDHQSGVADGAVGGGSQRDDHHPEVALGAGDLVAHRVGGLVEPVEAQIRQGAAQVRHRVVGQQHHRVLVDVRAQRLRVEVVLVQVGDVEVVDVAEGVPVQAAVVGEREPGGEVGGIDPRVAQDAAGACVDPKARMSDAGDLH